MSTGDSDDGTTTVLHPRGLADREEALAQAMEALPIFPLGMVMFPGQVFPLNIYEPRYRVMLQRITQEGGHRMFGLCPSEPPAEGPLAANHMPTVGTVIEVTQVRPDEFSSTILCCAVSRFATQPGNPTAEFSLNPFGYLQGACELVADEDEPDATRRALLWGAGVDPSAELLAEELTGASTATTPAVARRRANDRFLATARARRAQGRAAQDGDSKAIGALGAAEEEAAALREALGEAEQEHAATIEAESEELELENLCEQVETAIMLHAGHSGGSSSASDRESIGNRIAMERKRGASGFSMFAAGALVLSPGEKRLLLELRSTKERLLTLVALLDKALHGQDAAASGVQRDGP